MKTILCATLMGLIVPTLSVRANALPPDAVTDSKSVIPLSEVYVLDLGNQKTLSLEPGIRAVRSGSDYSLATYDGSKIEIVTKDGRKLLPSPVLFSKADSDLTFSGFSMRADAATIRMAVQDDTDSNLKSMQESAKKLKNKSNPNSQEANKQGQKKGHLRFLFGSSNPMGTSEAFSSTAIQQLTHTSAIGF